MMRSFFPKGEVRTHADHVNTLHAIVPDGFRIVVREVVVDNARNLESAAFIESHWPRRCIGRSHFRIPAPFVSDDVPVSYTHLPITPAAALWLFIH